MSPRQDQASSSLPKIADTFRQWLFYIIALAGTLISLILWYSFVLQSNTHIKQITTLQGKHIAGDIRFQFERRISVLQHMASHLGVGQGSADNNWQDVVEYIQHYGGFYGVALLDSTFKTTRLYPKNNPKLVNILSNFTQNYNKIAIHYLKTSNLWLSPPFEISPSKQGSFIVLPIKRGASKEYLISLVDFSKAFNADLLDSTNYAIMIYYDSKPVFQNKQLAPHSTTLTTEFHFAGILWKILIQPSHFFLSQLKSPLSSIALALGISIAILFALTVKLSQEARERAKSLDKINIDLKNEIAERAEAEDAKQKLEKALLQGQKLQAIGTLAGGIAHDFNNLLYAIIGYTEMARDDTPEDDLTHKNLTKVLEAAHRGQELVARILTFGRRQHHELKPIQLKATLENVLALLKPTIPASILIDYQANIPDNFTILGDQTRIHQVIVNIINNAVDSMDGEGTVTIKVNCIQQNDVLLQHFPEIKKCIYCKIDITDTGYGMDPSTIQRIFEPFFTTKEVGKGTGLGLATVHTIVEEHQGVIFVNSQLGHGSTFTILLPEYSLT